MTIKEVDIYLTRCTVF